jgi:hypothetical protein
MNAAANSMIRKAPGKRPPGGKIWGISARAEGHPGLIYPDAGHAFNRFGNRAWHETSATLARQRTLNLLREKVG